MKKKVRITSLILGIAFAAIPVLAQPPGSGRGERADEGGRRFDRLVEVLELSEEQAMQWRSIHEDHRAAARAQGRILADTRKQIEELAAAENPELAQLGQLTLDLYHGRQAMRDLRDRLESELVEVLTAEQQERFELLKRMRGDQGPPGRGEGRRQGRSRPRGNF